LLLLGIVWPLEGQPLWMRSVTTWLPMTKAIDAMRGILLKGNSIEKIEFILNKMFFFYFKNEGWSFEHEVTKQAFAVTFTWTTIFLIFTLFIFNCRRL